MSEKHNLGREGKKQTSVILLGELLRKHSRGILISMERDITKILPENPVKAKMSRKPTTDCKGHPFWCKERKEGDVKRGKGGENQWLSGRQKRVSVSWK